MIGAFDQFERVIAFEGPVDHKRRCFDGLAAGPLKEKKLPGRINRLGRSR
jgi:hypothetical protein